MCETEQLSFTDNISLSDLKENLKKIITSVCQEQGVDEKYIHCREIKDGKGYSVWICEPIDLKENFRSFSIYEKGKKDVKYAVEIIHKKIHKVPIPKDTVFDSKQKSTIFFPINHPELFEYLHNVLDYSLKNFEPKVKIGCCGRFNDCSDLKKCVHENTFYARACYYRKNLEAGRIFYGENRNVD